MVHFSYLLKAFQLRKSFISPNKALLQWFPGHMGKGLKQMQQKLKSVDCIIEVHDARIPLSGRNPDFKATVCGIKPHILVLNKKDLADLSNQKVIVEKLQEEGISEVIFTNCKDQFCLGLRQVIPTAKKLILQSDRYNRSEAKDFCIMIIGVPNVGKSSLINALRNRYLKKPKAAPVGAVAGITRSVTSKIKVSEDPLIYVLDTPGILTPTVRNIEAGLKLAVCSSMQDHLIGPMLIADYLLYTLNSQGNFKYVEYLGLNEPSDKIAEVLTLAALNSNKTVKKKDLITGYKIRPDVESAANNFIRAFRTGEFGKIILDEFVQK